MRLKNIIFNNLGLKLLTLFLAVVTWLYIVTELQKRTIEEREALQSILPYRMASKQMPIELNLMGKPQDGYMVVYDEIVIRPSVCVIVGPKSFLKELSSVKTEPIDISEHTKTITKDLSLEPPFRGVSIKDRFVNVTIPIIKAED